MKSISKKVIKRYEEKALSDRDVLSKLDGKACVILYPDLYKYQTLKQVLGVYKACILLIESRPKYGHWVCIFQHDNGDVEFFDSYGENKHELGSGLPDYSLSLIDPEFRDESNQNYTYLSKLMLDFPGNLHYNQYQFQKHRKGIRTCGRHCVFRLLNRHLEIDEYKKYMDHLLHMFPYLKDYDGVVSYFTKP